ncbi:hypothetical protein ACFSHQ_04215 [Gemmobacter lanyuensis]
MALTAHGLPEDLERFRRGGLTEILQKPVTIAQLVPYLTAQTPEPAGDDRAMPADFDVVVVGELRALLPAAQMRQLLDGILAEGTASLPPSRLANPALPWPIARTVCAARPASPALPDWPPCWKRWNQSCRKKV